MTLSPNRPLEIESMVDAHARGDRRRDGQRRHRCIESDARGDRGQAGHQGERIEVVVPELAFAAEAAQLDHRQHEVEAVALGVERDLAVEGEARLVLRRGRRDQPAVAADGDEDTDFHALRPPVMAPAVGMQDSDRAPLARKRSARSRLGQSSGAVAATRSCRHASVPAVHPVAQFLRNFCAREHFNDPVCDGGVRWHGNLLKPPTN